MSDVTSHWYDQSTNVYPRDAPSLLNTSKESKNRLSSLPLSECVKRLDSVVKTMYSVFGENSMRWNRPCSTERESLRAGLSSTHVIGRLCFELFGP